MKRCPGSPSFLYFIVLYGLIILPECISWRIAKLSPVRKLRCGVSTRPTVKSNTLQNGLKYIIFPNKYRPNAFDAYLEILSGSAHEKNNERGMAHFLEHIAYMGNQAMNNLSSELGLRTNAFTDYHHTVYYTTCRPFSTIRNVSKYPATTAVAGLASVLQAPIHPERLDAERAAVLSELSYVNTLSRRRETQILNDLHGDNMLPERSPIGLEADISRWTVDDLRSYQKRAYRPDNAVLYVVGDVDVGAVECAIANSFGGLSRVEESSGKVVHVWMLSRSPCLFRIP